MENSGSSARWTLGRLRYSVRRGSSASTVLLPTWTSRKRRALRSAAHDATMPIDEGVRHAHAVHAIPSGASLRDADDKLQGGDDGGGGIGFAPSRDLTIKLGEHPLRRELAENTHLGGKRVAVKSDDSIGGEYGAGEWSGCRDGPHRQGRFLLCRVRVRGRVRGALGVCGGGLCSRHAGNRCAYYQGQQISREGVTHRGWLGDENVAHRVSHSCNGSPWRAVI